MLKSYNWKLYVIVILNYLGWVILVAVVKFT